MAKECRRLTVEQLNELLADGWVLHGGPFATESQCLAECTTPATGTGTGTAALGTGTGSQPTGCQDAQPIQSGVQYGPYLLEGAVEEHWFQATAAQGQNYVRVVAEGAGVISVAVYATCEGQLIDAATVQAGDNCFSSHAYDAGTVYIKLELAQDGDMLYRLTFGQGACQ